MSLVAWSILPVTINLTMLMLGMAVVFSFVRLVRGPTLPDRVVALDVIVTIAVGAIAVYTIKMENPVFLLVAVYLALIAFLGSVAFAYYIRKGGEP